MSSSVKPNHFASEMQKILDQYKGNTVETMKRAVDESAKAAVKELKQTSPRQPRGGEYAKSWKSKKDKQKNKWAYGRTVYNEKHYRLTHLLENGHRIVRNGTVVGRALPRKHIAAAEKQAVENLITELEKSL